MALRSYFAVEQLQYKSDSVNVGTQKIDQQNLHTCKFGQQLKSSPGGFGRIKKERGAYTPFWTWVRGFKMLRKAEKILKNLAFTNLKLVITE